MNTLMHMTHLVFNLIIFASTRDYEIITFFCNWFPRFENVSLRIYNGWRIFSYSFLYNDNAVALLNVLLWVLLRVFFSAEFIILKIEQNWTIDRISITVIDSITTLYCLFRFVVYVYKNWRKMEKAEWYCKE